MLITALALTLATSGATLPGAPDVPAYGSITIAHDGAQLRVLSSYDPLLWDCRTHIEGTFGAPTAVTVTCEPLDEGASYSCPLMILSTTTGSPAARAGGWAACMTSIDTGIVSGNDTAWRSGDLGHVSELSCRAYGPGGIGGVLVPPYSVKCVEPGLPTL